MAEGGWAELPDELVEKVLEELQAAGHSEPQGPFGFSQATAKVRLVCSGWKAVHDALVKRLVLRLETTDEAVGMLARRFPAVVSLEFKGPAWGVLTDQGMLAVSNLHALTSLNLCCSSSGSSAHPPSATVSRPRCARCVASCRNPSLGELGPLAAPSFTGHMYVTCDHAPPTHVRW